MTRGFGVAAGLDPEVAAPLAARCQELGYSSVWSNDTPVANGLDTLSAFADGTDELELGVAVTALDRHDPATINERIETLGLDRERLWVGVGAGFDKRPLTRLSPPSAKRFRACDWSLPPWARRCAPWRATASTARSSTG